MTLTSSNKKRKSEETLPISSTSTSNQNQHQNHKKRKQTNTSPSSPSSSDSSSNSQSIKNQLKQIQIQLNQTKSQLLQSQNDLKSKVELLDSVRSSLRCNICFETFNSPYTLLCGHIFCHKDLYAWFHRLPSDYDTELEFDISDLDDYTNEPRREDRHQGRPIVPTSDRNQPSGNNPPEAPSTNTTDQPPPRVQPPRPSAYRKKKNLICPQCRTAVHTPPFQLYAIKEATDHLRKDEAQVENVVNSESPIRHDPEAHRNEKDLTWGNIFLGTHHLPRPIVHDVEDGVRRCGQCNWEIAADGICEGCGEIYSDVNDSDEGNSDDSDNRWAGQSQQSNSSWTDRYNESVYDSDQHHYHRFHHHHSNARNHLEDHIRAHGIRFEQGSDDPDLESSDQDHSDYHHEQRLHSSGVIESDDSEETFHHDHRQYRRRVIESDDSEERSSVLYGPDHYSVVHADFGPDLHHVVDRHDHTSDSRDHDHYDSDASQRGQPSQSDDSDASEQSRELDVDDRRHSSRRVYEQRGRRHQHDQRSDSFEGSEGYYDDDHPTIHEEHDQDSEASQYEGSHHHHHHHHHHGREWSDRDGEDEEEDSEENSYDGY